MERRCCKQGCFNTWTCNGTCHSINSSACYCVQCFLTETKLNEKSIRQLRGQVSNRDFTDEDSIMDILSTCYPDSKDKIELILIACTI